VLALSPDCSLFSQDKSRILDFTIPFKSPVYDWTSRRYSSSFQELLEVMVQRNPIRRWTARAICNHELIFMHYTKCELEAYTYEAELFALKRRDALKPLRFESRN
jgi:serine/threonine protein kinase